MTSSDVRPLPLLWGQAPSEADWAAVKAAYVSLGLPGLVSPVRAVPGGAGRVICVDCEPIWIVDYARIPSAESPGLKNAMIWALSDVHDERAVSMADMLSTVLGAKVTELEPEGSQQRVRFQ